MDQGDSTVDTKQRVLEAAGEVFAVKGFEKATIREIVEKAGANLNAVNYYFRDKAGLYLAVFEYAHQCSAISPEQEPDGFEQQSGEERIRGMIRRMLRGILSDKRKAWFPRLMFLEMAEPTGMLDTVVERLIRPRFEAIVSATREIVGLDVPEARVRLCAQSIVAQCVHASRARPIASLLIPELTYDHECVEQISRHIEEFSLAALRNMPLTEESE